VQSVVAHGLGTDLRQDSGRQNSRYVARPPQNGRTRGISTALGTAPFAGASANISSAICATAPHSSVFTIHYWNLDSTPSNSTAIWIRLGRTSGGDFTRISTIVINPPLLKRRLCVATAARRRLPTKRQADCRIVARLSFPYRPAALPEDVEGSGEAPRQLAAEPARLKSLRSRALAGPGHPVDRQKPRGSRSEAHLLPQR
jgi:hypothetical protein